MHTATFARPEFLPELRTACALPLAAGITVALLYGMHLLIKTDFVAPDETPPAPIVDIVMPDTKIVVEFPPLEKVPEPAQPPAIPETNRWQPPTGDSPLIALAPNVVEKITPKVGIGGGGLVKQVMIAPEYPRRLLTRGIEGFVDVQYDVTAYGTTENLRVVYSEPEGAFDRAALAAVAKWKFRPQIIDDQPVPTRDLRERVRFTIEK